MTQAEAMAGPLALPQPIAALRAVTKETPEHEARVTQGMRMAVKQPNSAITDSWQFLLDSTGELIQSKTGHRPATADVIVSAANYLDIGLVGMMTVMMSIPNEELSAGSATPRTDDAVRYVKLISRLHQRIKDRLQPADSREPGERPKQGDAR